MFLFPVVRVNIYRYNGRSNCSWSFYHSFLGGTNDEENGNLVAVLVEEMLIFLMKKKGVNLQ